jgi:hypothetical protein
MSAATKATVQYNKGEEPNVTVGPAFVYHGSFNVIGYHPLKVNTGIHQHSVFYPKPGSSNVKPLGETVDLPRLGDNVHRFEFGVPHGPPKYPY